MELNDRVKLARVLAGISVTQLAQRLGKARSNVITWESDSKYNLPAPQIVRVAEATGVPAAFLAGRALEGLVVARPGRHLTLNAVKRTCDWIDEVLPTVLPPDIESVTLEAAGRAAFVYFTVQLCLVIIPAAATVRTLRSGWAGVSHKRVVIPDAVLLAAYDSDAGVDELLRAAGVTGFTAEAAGTTATLRLRGGNKRQALDKLMELVEQLRREGCDVELEISDKNANG